VADRAANDLEPAVTAVSGATGQGMPRAAEEANQPCRGLRQMYVPQDR